MEAYVTRVKKAIRVKGNFDDEIKSYINACRLDLVNSGVKRSVVEDAEDDLILTAVILYVQAMFGIGDKDREKNFDLYERFKVSLKNANHGVENE